MAIKVPGRFIPGTINGVVVDSKYVKGGYIVVETELERDKLVDSDAIVPGSKVYVVDNGKEYIYNHSTDTGVSEWTDTFQDVLDIKKELQEQIDSVETRIPNVVEEVFNEKAPQLIDDRIDSKVSTITEDITEAATNAATERVESAISGTYVTTDSLQKNYYNKESVDAKISGVYHYKGSVPTYSDLPNNANSGDVYNVEDTGNNYAWTGLEWDNLGGVIDLGNYYTKSESEELVETKLSSYETIEGVNEKLNLKQDKLVSGTNIKTINGVSLLGSGDITIQSSSQSVVQVSNFEDLPLVGSKNSIYIVDSINSLYRWDTFTSSYICVGSNYKQVTIIDGGNATSF